MLTAGGGEATCDDCLLTRHTGQQTVTKAINWRKGEDRGFDVVTCFRYSTRWVEIRRRRRRRWEMRLIISLSFVPLRNNFPFLFSLENKVGCVLGSLVVSVLVFLIRWFVSVTFITLMRSFFFLSSPPRRRRPFFLLLLLLLLLFIFFLLQMITAVLFHSFFPVYQMPRARPRRMIGRLLFDCIFFYLFLSFLSSPIFLYLAREQIVLGNPFFIGPLVSIILLPSSLRTTTTTYWCRLNKYKKRKKKRKKRNDDDERLKRQKVIQMRLFYSQQRSTHRHTCSGPWVKSLRPVLRNREWKKEREKEKKSVRSIWNSPLLPHSSPVICLHTARHGE